MNEAPKLLIFRQKTAKKGQMENGRKRPRNQSYLQSRNGVENYQFKSQTAAKLTSKTIIFR
jgi:hypothetical protein